jgi:hypothetical protein
MSSFDVPICSWKFEIDGIEPAEKYDDDGTGGYGYEIAPS